MKRALLPSFIATVAFCVIGLRLLGRGLGGLLSFGLYIHPFDHFHRSGIFFSGFELFDHLLPSGLDLYPCIIG